MNGSRPPRQKADANANAGPMDPAMRRRLAEFAHDLNTPLSAVRLQLFLHRHALASPTPEALRSLDIMERNVERIRTLIASLVPTEQAPPSMGPRH